eukprot:g30314.t1
MSNCRIPPCIPPSPTTSGSPTRMGLKHRTETLEENSSREAEETLKKWQQVKKGKGELPSGGLYMVLTAMRQLKKTPVQVEAELRQALTSRGSNLLSDVQALPTALLRDDAIELLPPVLQVLQDLAVMVRV